MRLWQHFTDWFNRQNQPVQAAVVAGMIAVLVAFITGAFTLTAAIINTIAKPTPAPLLTPSPAPPLSPTATASPVSDPTPEAPQPKKATTYYTSDGRLLIEVLYDPPQLRRGETLSFQASTRESFDDTQPLLPPSNIEFVEKGRTEGRLLYDPKDQPVWVRLIIIDGQGKPWYGKSIKATKR
jgi:hypothetical protein